MVEAKGGSGCRRGDWPAGRGAPEGGPSKTLECDRRQSDREGWLVFHPSIEASCDLIPQR